MCQCPTYKPLIDLFCPQDSVDCSKHHSRTPFPCQVQPIFPTLFPIAITANLFICCSQIHLSIFCFHAFFHALHITGIFILLPKSYTFFKVQLDFFTVVKFSIVSLIEMVFSKPLFWTSELPCIVIIFGHCLKN